jgi:hypothetical protein
VIGCVVILVFNSTYISQEASFELLEIHQSEKIENKRQEYDDSLSSEEQIAYFETEKTRFLVEKIQSSSLWY